MQIELIGCTSAGKSTLSKSIIQACHGRGLNIVMGDDFVLGQIRLNWIRSRLLRKLLVNLTALFAGLVTWPTNNSIYQFAAGHLVSLPITQFEKLNTLKNVVKRIGIYEIIRFRSSNQQVILIDEGVLQAAHYLFVHVSADVKTEHISTFAELIPLPNVIIYLRQPEALLIDRTMMRGHQRIKDRSYRNVVLFVKRAVTTFDKLVQNPAVKNKLLVIDGVQNVIMVSNCQENSVFNLALEIIQESCSDMYRST